MKELVDCNLVPVGQSCLIGFELLWQVLRVGLHDFEEQLDELVAILDQVRLAAHFSNSLLFEANTAFAWLHGHEPRAALLLGFFESLTLAKAHEVVLELHVAIEEEEGRVVEDFRVELVLLRVEALHGQAAVPHDAVIFDILTEEPAELVGYIFAELRVHRQEKHGLTLDDLGDSDRFQYERIELHLVLAEDDLRLRRAYHPVDPAEPVLIDPVRDRVPRPPAPEGAQELLDDRLEILVVCELVLEVCRDEVKKCGHVLEI